MSIPKAAQRAKPASLAITGPEKVALLLLALGSDRATRLLRRLDPIEIDQLSRLANRLRPIEAGEFELLVEEFNHRYTTGPNFIATGDAIQNLLSGVTREADEETSSNLPEPDIGPTIWEQLEKLEPTALLDYIARERPQTGAIILSKLETSVVASILALMEPGMRTDLIRRILTLGSVRPIALEAVEQCLRTDFLSEQSAVNLMGVAKILNRLDKTVNTAFLESLAELRPADAKKLRGMVFDFNDIVHLPARARGLIFDQVSADRLVMALHGTLADFQATVLTSLSARSRRNVELELSSSAVPSANVVANARREIVDLVLSLAAKGTIQLVGSDARPGRA